MKKAVIVIDKYKLPTFETEFKAHNIKYDASAGPTLRTISITIFGDTMAELLELREFISTVNNSAREWGRGQI